MNNEMMILFLGGVLVILVLAVTIFRSTKPKREQKTEPMAVDAPLHANENESSLDHPMNNASQYFERKQQEEPIIPNLQTHNPQENYEPSPTRLDEKEDLPADKSEPAVTSEEEQTAEERWQKTLKAMFKRRIEAHTLETKSQVQSQTIQPSSSTVVVYLMAKRSKPFKGKDLLSVLGKYNFVYNRKQKLFHQLDTSKNVLFQLCQARKPGIFNIETMQANTTDGLIFFLDLNQLASPKATFKAMLETIHGISKKLGGDILDDNKSRLTESSVCMYLAKIKGIESYRKKEHVD